MELLLAELLVLRYGFLLDCKMAHYLIEFRFFGSAKREMKQLIWEIVGDVPVSWRTVCQFPASTSKIATKIERSSIVQRFPFGTFAGIVVTLVPKVRTKPLALKYRPKFKKSIASGYESIKNVGNLEESKNNGSLSL